MRRYKDNYLNYLLLLGRYVVLDETKNPEYETKPLLEVFAHSP
jgi:hypothetical protein